MLRLRKIIQANTFFIIRRIERRNGMVIATLRKRRADGLLFQINLCWPVELFRTAKDPGDIIACSVANATFKLDHAVRTQCPRPIA